jgi:hypothetical protein
MFKAHKSNPSKRTRNIPTASVEEPENIGTSEFMEYA